jgi:hypothetical protein
MKKLVLVIGIIVAALSVTALRAEQLKKVNIVEFRF